MREHIKQGQYPILKHNEVDMINENIKIDNDDTILWIGRPSVEIGPGIGFFFILTLNIIVVFRGLRYYSMAIYNHIDIFHVNTINFSKEISFLAFFLVACYWSVRSIMLERQRITMIYGYTNKKVFWIRKEHKIIINELLYTKIHKLSIVGYTDRPSCYSVYFFPTENINFGGYDYIKFESRPTPNFELVLNGDKIYHELNELLYRSARTA